MPAEIDLNRIARGTVVAPAGCGKTQLIANALGAKEAGKPTLVLTHTNAGVAALRGRLERAGVKPGAYRVATLDGFAMRLIGMFPERSGHEPRILKGARPGYNAIRDAAARLVAAGHVSDILAASYDRLIVDEYQDCSVRQHALVTWLAQTLPAVALGDPFQSIFGFGGDPLPEWAKVLQYFPPTGELSTPWRWNNAGAPALGQWLLALRDSLARGVPVDLRLAPPGVEWVPLDGRDDEGRRLRAASVDAPGDMTVVVIGDSMDPPGQRRLARQVQGAVTVEAVDLRDLTEFGSALALHDADALSILAAFAESLMSAFSGDDLVRAVMAARVGALGRAPTTIEQAGLAFESERTYRRASDLLAVVNAAGGVRCYRPAVLAATHRALALAGQPGGPAFSEATLTIREQSRLVGRPLSKRSVGSTLLLKGLEADISVILNAGPMDARNLYVAMTRGSRRLIVCSPSPVLIPGW